MFDLPGGCLGDAEAAAKFEAGHALLALGQMIHGAKPETWRQFGRSEDRSGDRQGLPATGAALEKVARLDHAELRAAAGGTEEAVRPAGSNDDRAAL